MKKRFAVFLLTLLFMLGIGVTAHAATTAGLIYDETEQLLTEDTQKIGTDYFTLIAEEKKIAPYLDIYTGLGGAESLEAAAEFVYTNSGFGVGEDQCGMLLALYAVPDGDSWTLDADQPFALYCNKLPDGLKEEILTATEAYVSDWAWEDGLENDRRVLMGLAAALGNTVMHFGEEAIAAEPETKTEPTVETEAPAQPAEEYARYESYEGEYLIDSYGLLTGAEQAALESYARQASGKHGCGIYVMIVDDYKQLNGNNDIFKANYTYYHDHNMGLGEGRDGVFLLLSMEARDFSFFVFGEDAEYALNKWGQKKLEEEFIDDLADNRWYDGLEDFVSTCDEYLGLAEQGDPVREPPQSKLALSTGISSFIALLVSSFMWNKNKGAKKRTSAYGYVSGTLICDISDDRYINTTVTKRTLEDNSDSGNSGSGNSVSRSGGGGSGRSGKF